MSNKYSNIIFYTFIIVCTLFIGSGALMRYKADKSFDLARKAVGHYAKTNNGLDYIQHYYNTAVGLNPLETVTYANILNGDFLREVGRR